VDWFDSIVLGLVQGLTEFLPVSSSGHLRIGHALFAKDAESLFFDIVLHVGTLLAVIGFYGRDIRNLLVDAWWTIRKEGLGRAFADSIGVRTIVAVVVATIPTGIIGVLLKDAMEGPAFTVRVVGGLLMLNGAILFASKWAGPAPAEGPEEHTGASAANALKSLSVRNAVILGLAQGFAVLPGISRSGSTIVTALALGVPREQAARLSFLMSIPAILGALALSTRHGVHVPMDELGPMITGAAVAAISGLGALLAVVMMLRKARLHHFAWYCWALGLWALISG
jgi:undecaprenyl-diphosphatase